MPSDIYGEENRKYGLIYSGIFNSTSGINRLNQFIETSILTAEYFGNLYKKNRIKFFNYYKVYVSQISYLLNEIGININTVPVLDVKRLNSNKIIGNRSYSTNPYIVSKIGDYCIAEYHKYKISTMIKHIPGHGSAKVDSHKYTPIVKNSLIINFYTMAFWIYIKKNFRWKRKRTNSWTNYK